MHYISGSIPLTSPSPQKVLWVASDLSSIPPGSIVINPQTGTCLTFLPTFLTIFSFLLVAIIASNMDPEQTAKEQSDQG